MINCVLNFEITFFFIYFLFQAKLSIMLNNNVKMLSITDLKKKKRIPWSSSFHGSAGQPARPAQKQHKSA